MSAVVKGLFGELAAGPKATKLRQAQADAIISVAAKVRDWPLLERAVDAKIEDQAEFVAWWNEKVRRAGGDTRSDNVVSRPDTMDVASAEASTGITKLQVSRWRTSLADRPRYRDRMILAAYRKADIKPAENHRAEGTGDNEWFTPAQYIASARHPVPRDSFRLVLDAWPSLAALASELRERYPTAHNWWRRNSVPRWYWPALVRSAERLGISGISHARLELLDRLRHAPPRKRVA